MVDVSVVIPVYFNEGLLRSTFAALWSQVVMCHPDLEFEVVFIDDGSGDGSLDELLQIQQDYPQAVNIIKLSRNFGQVSALTAGFAHATGRCVVAMSADGQDPVGLINEMLDAHFREGYQIVIGTREGRDESPYRVLTSRLFYWLIRKLSFPNMPPGGFDFVLMSRRATEILLDNLEAYPFFQGQLLWMGFKPKFILYRRLERKVGRSRWTFGKKITYLIDGVLAYSYLPMRIMSGTGILMALLGFLYALIVFMVRIMWGNPIQGWAPLMMVILVMGGLQMLMLGVVGEYLWRTLAQVRNRDPYIIERIYEHQGEQAEVSLEPGSYQLLISANRGRQNAYDTQF
jgi:polyisoprenyl-phosphate glycosyltransferase